MGCMMELGIGESIIVTEVKSNLIKMNTVMCSTGKVCQKFLSNIIDPDNGSTADNKRRRFEFVPFIACRKHVGITSRATSRLILRRTWRISVGDNESGFCR
jgi:hypothetical protein